MWKLMSLFLFLLSSFVNAGLVIKQDIHQERYSPLFGLHFHRIGCEKIGGGDDGGRWPTSLDVPIVRLWDSGVDWKKVEAEANVYDFSCFDHYIKQAQRSKAKVIYTFANSPQWASARPYEPCAYGIGCAAEPLHMRDWENYVRAVITRYHGQIDYYEVWNEPMLQEILRDKGKIGFYSGSVKKLVEMARVVRDVLNNEDPNAKLLTPAFTNGADRLDLFFNEGGAGLVDGVSYHFYANGSYHFFENFLDVKKVIDKYGLSNKPLLNTEWGVARSAFDDLKSGVFKRNELQAAKFMAQLMILNVAANFRYSVYYSYDDQDMGLVDVINKRSLPQYKIFQFMRNFTTKLKIDHCEAELTSFIYCDGSLLGDPIRIFWSGKPLDIKLTIPTKYSFALLSDLDDVEKITAKRVKNGDLIFSNEDIKILWLK